MSTSSVEPVVTPEATAEATVAFSPRTVVSGASALIVATGTERAFGFLANLFAARIGGAGTFGGYSLAMTTANNIAAYAGAGIGSTATRFSGEFPEGSAGAAIVARALLLVSLASALLASSILFLGSGPLARVLLRQPNLASLLRWASLSAGVMILFECCRGFLIGQQKLRTLLLFSGVMGMGMLLLLPVMSRAGAVAMVCTQATVGAVAIAAVLVSSYRLFTGAQETGDRVVKMARRVWSFGLVQLLGIMGLNAAGWWITSVVSRSDSSLVEMGIFAVANQVRNVVALVPGLLTQSSFALMANEDAAPSRVLLFCTLLATLVVLVLGGAGVVLCPVLLPLLWGKAYGAGVLASSLAFATAIVHMSGSAAAARLTILSLPLTGVINAVWSALVFGLSALLFSDFHSGNAASIAAGIYLVAHVVSSVLVMVGLMRRGRSPEGLPSLFLLANGTALSLAGFAALRAASDAYRVVAAAGECVVVIGGTVAVLWLGRRHGFSPETLIRPILELPKRFTRRTA